MYRALYILLLIILNASSTFAQLNNADGAFYDSTQGTITDGTNRYTWGRDSTHTVRTDVPEGFFQWTIDPRLGTITPQPNDTAMAGFYRSANNDGDMGRYTHLGNLGSPRISRRFDDRPLAIDAYLIANQYDYVRPTLATFRFWNTKSPITNLTYHSAGDSEMGEDHLRVTFASNINKRAGIGFLIDYAYGRGYYSNQGNSLFNGSLYGYYHGDRYQMHVWISSNHFKTTENGGVENDQYIKNPEAFERDFTSSEVPVTLTQNWNRNDDQTYYLTHRYNLGFERDIEMSEEAIRDSLAADSTFVIPQEFIPVTSFIHTLQIRHLKHKHYGRRESEGYYRDNLYGTLGQTADEQYNTNIRNTLGVQLCEGFARWAKAGLTAYVTHDYNIYHIPDHPTAERPHPLAKYCENDLSFGGTLARTGGDALHFNVNAEAVVVGDNIGNANIDGTIHLRFPVLRDTCMLALSGGINNNRPSFFLRHWHSQHAWWDSDLDNELRTYIRGTFNLHRTKTQLTVGWQNISNYTYLATHLTPNGIATPSPTTDSNLGYMRWYSVQQTGPVQVLSATLNQDFRLGILNWQNEVIWQHSTNDKALPLPTISLYTNLYLHFRIARILRVDLGADMRYWTAYHSPDYAPVLNQYTTQDADRRVSVGNHPIINVYVNAQMKRLRFYVAANHVNAGSHYGFNTVHYPINPMNIHFGLSWNFIN